MQQPTAPVPLPVTPIKGRWMPWATLALIAANLGMFAVEVVRGGTQAILLPDPQALLDLGANQGLLVAVEHEWWRPLSAMFVHVGALHLVANMYSLFQVGAFAERLWGRTYFVLAYLITGLAGSFASLLYNPEHVSAGASGAIFGVFGLIVGFTFRARNLLPPDAFRSLRSGIVLTLIFNLTLALFVPVLDNAAHLGGLLAGVLAGVTATASAIEQPSKRPSLGSQLIVVASVAALAVLADVRTRSSPLGKTFERTGPARKALLSGDWALAEQRASEAIAEKDEPEARRLRALAHVQLEHWEDALKDLDVAVQSSSIDAPSLPQILAMKAQIELHLGLDAEAGRDLARLSDLTSNSEGALLVRGTEAVQRGDYELGIRHLRQARKLRPADAGIANNLAWALVMSNGDLKEALDAANLAVEDSPKSTAFLGTRCWVHALREEKEAAIADCEAAVKSGTTYVDAGMLAYLKGDWAEAIKQWERAGEDNKIEEREMKPWIAKAREKLAPGG